MNTSLIHKFTLSGSSYCEVNFTCYSYPNSNVTLKFRVLLLFYMVVYYYIYNFYS